VQQWLYGIEKYFQIVGIPLAVIYASVLLIWQARKRSSAFDAWYSEVKISPSYSAKRILTIALMCIAVIAYFYCYSCKKTIYQKASHEASFLHMIVSFSIRVFPYFVAGCVLAGLIERYMSKKNRWLPKSMIGAGIFASLLPICSCAAVPFSYSLMATGKIRLRAVITFMMVVPVLNPFVIAFSQGVLGWRYTILRIVTIFALAMITGVLIEYFLGERTPDDIGAGCYFCKGCAKSGAMKHDAKSVLDAAYNLMTFLAPYMIIGIAIGAAFMVFMPPFIVGKYLSSKFIGLLLAVLIGLPLYLCSGEEVLILAPLMQMGLPMGHAIALTIAGNGICLSSIALLVPLFGKKATVAIIIAFLLGSLLIGLAINYSDLYLSTVF